jgi:hypothetical protein
VTTREASISPAAAIRSYTAWLIRWAVALVAATAMESWPERISSARESATWATTASSSAPVATWPRSESRSKAAPASLRSRSAFEASAYAVSMPPSAVLKRRTVRRSTAWSESSTARARYPPRPTADSCRVSPESTSVPTPVSSA